MRGNSGRRDPAEKPRALHEKSWLRNEATAWDEKWHKLSLWARVAYLDKIKPPTKPGSATQPSILAASIEPEVLQELVDAGFVKVEPAEGKRAAKAVASDEAYDFSSRIRTLRRFELLERTSLENLTGYLKHVYIDAGHATIYKVLAGSQVIENIGIDDALKYYVATMRWPGLVAQASKSTSVKAWIDALVKAPGPVRLADLVGLVKGASEVDCRASLDVLVASMAVFEDVDPKTLDLIVGMLPLVRQDYLNARKPPAEFPLIVCDRPKDVAPASGLAINDLRVFLLEVEGQSPRLRQDGQLFAKEEPRFLDAMPEWPPWLYEFLKQDLVGRINEVYSKARLFGFTEIEQDDRLSQLRLTKKGRAWLASTLAQQYAAVYEKYREIKIPKNSYYYYGGDGEDYDGGYAVNDSKFLSSGVAVMPSKGRTTNNYFNPRDHKPEHRQATREAVYQSLASLPVGVFHVWESVVDHLCSGKKNPLTGGQDLAKFTIFLDHRAIPRFPDRVRDVAKTFLNNFLRKRLIPLEAVQAAIDDKGRLCVARLARLDGYFGKTYDQEADTGPEGGKVIVQPDFSVVVIGLNPAPAAELARFCERASGHAGLGAMTFKITRTSVVRAASQGLTGTEMNARLQKHASIAVPPNVLQEIREWAGWVRRVNVQPVNVIRCPDAETADRVQATMGKRSERLGQTMVVIDLIKLLPADRQKLLDQGIVITKDEIIVTRAEAHEKSPPTEAVPKKRGRPKKIR